MNKLIFNNKTLAHPLDKNLFVLRKDSGIYIPSSCYKAGTCKECVIKINEGEEYLNERTIHEKHLKSPFRLACQTKIIKDNSTIVCSTLKRDEIVIEDTSYLTKDIEVENKLNPRIRKDKDGNVYLDEKLIDKASNSIFGLGGKQLKRILNSYISDALNTLVQNPQNIYLLTIGGNTTMRDIFFGLNIKPLGQSPYLSTNELRFKQGNINTTTIETNAKSLRIPIHNEAKVYSPPIIGNHIGSDITAGLIATGFNHSGQNNIFIDIGTNTEIIIGNKEMAYASSSPSGPAFEGGGITFGMPALKGAIERIKIKGENVIFEVIGNSNPVGICGSGLIDILGELKRTKKINNTGRFTDDIENDKFYISKEHDIFITENDINQLAQAKGSNSAAIEVLMNKAGLTYDKIDTVYLAGGFGKHIDLDMAKLIGLLPNIDNSKFKRIGNSCIEGLTISLLDKDKTKEIDHFVKNIQTVNLESEDTFFDYFVSGCLFSPMGEEQNEDDDF